MKNVKAVIAMVNKVKTLWLVTRTDAIGYDEYDSCVVAATNETTALAHAYSLWKDSATVKCEEIGTTKKPSGIIHDSYRAG